MTTMVSGKSKQKHQPMMLRDSPSPPSSSLCAGRSSAKAATAGTAIKHRKAKLPLHETGNGAQAYSPNPVSGRDVALGNDTVLPAVCSLLPQSSPIPAISNGLTLGDEIVSAKSRVELVRSSEPGRSDLGLILAGGADKEDRLHVISIQPGSTAHRTDRILVGDYITAINGVSTHRLKQNEIMTLIGNSRHSLLFELHYRMCPSAISRTGSSSKTPKSPDVGAFRGSPIETRRTEITISRDVSSGPTLGLVLRGGARMDRDRACPVFVVQVRPGTCVHRDGGIRPGDRILAINGTSLTGLHLDEVYGLMADFHAQQSTLNRGPNHQAQPVRLLIEYDILKGGFEAQAKAAGDEWGMEFCRQSGSDVGLSLSAAYVDGRSCIVVDSVRPASFADRTGVIKAGDILLAVNGQTVDNKMPMDVMTLLKYGSFPVSSGSPKLGNSLRLQFLRPVHPVPQPSLSTGSLRPPDSTRNNVGMSQSYHATLSTSGANSNNNNNSGQVAKRSATSAVLNCATTADTAAPNAPVLGVAATSTPTLMRRGTTLGRGADMTAPGANLMMPTSATNSMSRLKRRGSVGSVTSFSSTCSANGGYVFHSETMDVFIEATSVAADCEAACGGLGASFGISIQKSTAAAVTNTPPTGTINRSTLYHPQSSKNFLTIGGIEFNSPADRIGLLQEGDRILQINGHPLMNKPAEIAAQLLHDSGPVCQLRVEFDVADSFAISNGVFHVRLPNRGPSLGLAVVSIQSDSQQAKSNLPQSSRLFVSDIRRGSVAYRCGNLLVGDEILSVNGCHLESPVDLISNIQHAGEIVVLKIRRLASHNKFYVVTYGVHFEIGDTPLGVGLARTDNPFYPFVVTLLDESGLAFRSGAVHLGDYLVAVNDLDLSGCTLQQLQDTLDTLSPDSLVVLRLCRVGGLEKTATDNLVKLPNKTPSAPAGQTPPGPPPPPGSDGPSQSPGGNSSSGGSSSDTARSPNSNKDGSTSSERGGHVRSVDSAICSDALPLKTKRDHPHDPIALSDFINNALSMSRQSCYDNLRLDPTTGDWVPSSSSTSLSNGSNTRQMLAALESAIWDLDVAKLKLDVSAENHSQMLTKSVTLPNNKQPSTIPSRNSKKNSPPSGVRPSMSFGMPSATPKPIYIAAEHFFVNDRPVSGAFQMTSATQTEVSPPPQHAASSIHRQSPALASVASSSLLVSSEGLIDEEANRLPTAPEESITLHGDQKPQSSSQEQEETTRIIQSEEEKPLKKSPARRSFRRVSDAILRRLFDRSPASPKIKREKSSANRNLKTSGVY